MAKTAEDNFRIEVWDREEKVLVETISRSPDSSVSQAAWQATIRRRSGMLLIHYNSPYIMEKLLTSGNIPVEPQTIVDGSVQKPISQMELSGSLLCEIIFPFGWAACTFRSAEPIVIHTFTRMRLVV